MIVIQNGNANDVDRDDINPNTDGWNEVASGETYKEALINLVEAINNEEVNTEDGFLRIVNVKNNVVVKTS